MANEIFKELKTKIALKYNTYEYWTTGAGKDYAPLKGEVCFCEIPTGNTEATTAPTVLFKVGVDGVKKFSELKWASALAADVYEWAKQSTLFIQKDGTGNVVSGIEWDASLNGGKGGVKFTTAAVATAQGLEDLQKEVYGEDGSAADSRIDKLEKDIADNRAAWEKDDDTTYTFTETAKGFSVTPKGGTAQTFTFAYLTEEEVRALIPSTLGVMSVEAGNDAVEVSGTENVKVGVKLAAEQGNVVLTTEGGLKAAVDLSAYRLIADDEDTKYGLTYDSTNKVIKIVENGGDTEISAADFVKDGMLQSVTVSNENNTITFTWNTDGGVTETTVKLSDIADIYTAAENATEVQVAISNTNVVSATLVNGGVTEAKLEQNVKDALALARTALQTHQDITGKADKVTGAVAGNFAGLDANGNLVDSGKKAEDFDAAGAATTAKEEAIAAAAKDAGDKAAVALGEAQKYADEKVAALAGDGNTTTVKAVADRVESLENANHISDVEADTGLKVIVGTNGANNKVAIDETVVFVLDCNW